jgi:hypothetical protein
MSKKKPDDKNSAGVIVAPVEFVDINSIHTNEKNPRYIKEKEFKELIESIKSFPEMLEARPSVVDETGMILGGNQRWRAAKEAGLSFYPVVRMTGLSDEQKREFIIKDNTTKGQWDWDILANEWDKEELLSFGLEVLTYSDEDLTGLFKQGDVIQDENKNKIVLNYTDADFKLITDALNAIGGTKESAIYNLLIR